MNQFFKILLSWAGVHLPTYEVADVRSKKLVLALSTFLYISAFLSGYAMFTALKFLVNVLLVPFIISSMVMVIMIWHDQSLLSTAKVYQVVLKLLFSLVLAVAFTVTHNTERDAETLKMEIIQHDKQVNAEIRANMNAEIEAIDQEELVIMERIENAGRDYDDTGKKQTLIDARRSLTAFQETKEERKERIRESYQDKFFSTEVSQMDLLSLQARKMLDGEDGSFVAFVLSFLFFGLESLPVILRLLLNGSEYIRQHHSDLRSVEELRDQSITSKHNFIDPEGDIIKELFTIDIIEEKRKLILNNFQDKDAMRKLAYRKVFLDNNLDPYTGKPLSDIPWSLIFDEDVDSKDDPSVTEDQTYEGNDDIHENADEEPETIFEF